MIAKCFLVTGIDGENKQHFLNHQILTRNIFMESKNKSL